MTTIKIEYDDQLDEVVEKVNKVLKEKGLEFVDDGQPHDGYCIYELSYSIQRHCDEEAKILINELREHADSFLEEGPGCDKGVNPTLYRKAASLIESLL